ncbi:MAG: DUF805 domain-containing protein [Rhizobiales bacterium]|nr:DUF805 domain-containing protein [Hyphomicrobiales bacterium]
MNIVELYTSFDGRISRSTWWLGILMLLVPSLVAISVVQSVGNDILGNEPGTRNAFSSILSLLLVWPETALTKKRLNDRGHAPWVAQTFVLVSIASATLAHFGFFDDPASMGAGEIAVWAGITAYSLWLLVENGFLKGTEGRNPYGPDPLQE